MFGRFILRDIFGRFFSWGIDYFHFFLMVETFLRFYPNSIRFVHIVENRCSLLMGVERLKPLI